MVSEPTAAQDYSARVIAAIRKNLVFSSKRLADADLRLNPSAEVEVELSANGRIEGSRLLKSSGAADWDKAVMRAIEKTQWVPLDADGKASPTMLISFRPRP
jgi:colicin import membrane protein